MLACTLWLRRHTIDYSLTDKQKQIVETAPKFAIDEFQKVASESDREEKFPIEI